jgi:hypothetical protein
MSRLREGAEAAQGGSGKDGRDEDASVHGDRVFEEPSAAGSDVVPRWIRVGSVLRLLCQDRPIQAGLLGQESTMGM